MRLVAAALLVAAPSAAAFLLLAAGGALAPGLAALAFIAVLLATILLLRPALRGLVRLREAIERLAHDAEGAPSLRSATPFVDELWLAAMRLARSGRQHLARREAEHAAARAVMAALPDPLILFDAKRRIVAANAAAEATFGAVPIERDLAAVLRNPAVLAAADAVLRGEPARAVELTLSQPVERELSARLTPLPPNHGSERAAAILTLHDLTAIKRTDRMRADFVANASHELRTPLATLLGFIETLRGPAREDAEAQARFLAIMQEQAARMARLIDDLLSLSRIEMNEHVPPSGKADLRTVIGSVADTLELRAASRGMRIALDLPPDLPAALGAADELAQVFQNLIDNAIKYGREGTPIEVSGRLVDRRPGGPFIAVTVRDEGEGIRREHLPRLTERFYRVDTARSRALGGTGLGLAIVKHILNRHRGRLEIESELGLGSSFTVLLRPAAAEEGPAPAP